MSPDGDFTKTFLFSGNGKYSYATIFVSASSWSNQKESSLGKLPELFLKI